MRFKSFEFNLRELAGSLGDFGTLLPLTIGYIVVCGVDPTGLLVMIGVANIVTGLVYRIPMPIEPMKVIAVIAIAQHWSPSMVCASGVAMGVAWLLFSITGTMNWVAKMTPFSVIRGIQVALGALMAAEALKMLATGWALGIFSILIVLVLRENRYAPATIVLIVLGMTIVLFKGQFIHVEPPNFVPLTIADFSLGDMWQTLVLAGFAQIPLTATNAVIATSSLIKTYWPDTHVNEKQLSLNMGIMNAVLPFFGSMPLCHGAGGLASQYYFGARTGGANIIEGLIEISVGLFLAASIAELLTLFPTAIIGAMMFMVGIELTKLAKDVRWGKDLLPMTATLIVSLVSNMAYGYLTGLILYHLTVLCRRWTRAM